MANIFKPPTPWKPDHRPSVFLAGTIDQGNSIDWQAEVTQQLNHLDIDILNPRRDKWDVTVEQSINNPVFKAQVDWELFGLENSRYILMYFAPNSKSPITLLELGLRLGIYGDEPNNQLIVCCPTTYWRRGNVEIVCANKVPCFDDLQSGIDELIRRIERDQAVMTDAKAKFREAGFRLLHIDKI